ncbi:MAG: hypothetical protein KAG66_15855, partial [Methylococcales bacterium]|nr:hypothetical protein [Methylococcales bacterium]
MMINLLKLNLVPSMKQSMTISRKVLATSVMMATTMAMVSTAQAGIEFSIRQSEGDPEVGSNQFTVFARSSQAISGVQSMVSSAQVSVLIPLDADLNTASGGVLASQNGVWQVNSWNGSTGAGNAGQTDQPDRRVMSIGQVALGTKIQFLEAGGELALFDFSSDDCQAGKGV